MFTKKLLTILAFSLLLSGLSIDVTAQKEEKPKPRQRENVRLMTIPISIFTKEELKKNRADEFIEAGNLIVKEDKEDQEILSIRSVSSQPLALAILIQDDLSSNFNLQLKDIAEFIRTLPEGSRVMVGYIRGGTMQVRQKFTRDLDKASKSLRVVLSTNSAAPRSPYDGVISALKRFKSIPTGRQAILLISDGLDVSQGFRSSSPAQSNDLARAILRAQRSGVAVYSFYASATYTESGNTILVGNGQGSLLRLSEETGGKAFFSGRFTAISYQPFFRDLTLALNRQFALTYLSTHMDKGYHEVEVISTNPEVRIEHPKGYYYKKPKFR
ncbi:MAG: hypothetical protein HKN25_14310 [Pyrinomonadaceae bacterium]|nr:hypothetical protein [Pyrinomonadaceae bacterium]